MGGTFAICITDPKYKKINVDGLHLNIWQLSLNNLFMEVGLKLQMSKVLKKVLDSTKGIRFLLYSPFLVEEEIKDLYNTFLNKENIQLIFNDEVRSMNPKNAIPEKDVATLVKFKNRSPLLFCKAEVKRLREDKIEIRLKYNEIKKTRLQDDLHYYIRFRCKLLSGSPNIYTSSGSFYDKVFFDIRFNESRLFPSDEISFIHSNKLGIDDLHVFIIQAFDSKISLYDEKKLQYIRFLEKERFFSYIGNLKGTRDPFLVYYWRIKKMEDSFDMVAGFEKEKEPIKQIGLGVLINIASGTFFYITEFTKPFLPGFLNLFAYIFATILLGIGTALILTIVIKYLMGKEYFRHRVIKIHEYFKKK